MIRKTLIVARKQCRRQINTKVWSSKSAILLILSFFLRSAFVPTFVQTMIAQKRFKSMLTTAQSSTTTHRLNSFKYPPDQQRCSQHCPAAVHCARCHFVLHMRTHSLILRPKDHSHWSWSETSTHRKLTSNCNNG